MLRDLLIACVIVIAGDVCPASESAFPAKSYLIVARHNGQCLDVRGAGREMAPVQTAGFGQQTNREWMLTSTETGFYTIAAMHSMMLLDVRGAAGENAFLQTGGFGTQKNREFSLVRNDDGFYVISARHSGLSLDVRDAGRYMAMVQTAGHGGQTNREWLVIPSDFRSPEYVSKSATLYRFGVATVLKEPCTFDFAECDGHLIIRVPLDFLRSKTERFIKDELPKMTNEVKVGAIERQLEAVEDGLQCRLRLTHPFKGWVNLKLTVEAWPGKEVGVRVRITSSHADDFFEELAKAIVDADKQANSKAMPPFSAAMTHALRELPFWSGVQMVGIQSDGVVCVLRPGFSIAGPPK